MSNKTLYIIGNGFDLYHGLKTSYADFCRYVKENDKELFGFLEWYVYLESDENGLWSSFEQNLGTFDHRLFYSDYDNTDPLGDENFQPSHMFGVVDELREIAETMIEKMQQTLFDWLDEIDYADTNCKVLPLDANARYLTFNYTATLNRLYSISDDNILHIHHSVAKDGYDLVFGHGTKIEQEPLSNEHGDGNYPSSAYYEAEVASKMLLARFYKDTKAIIQKNTKFFETLRDTENIIILGHSLNEIDLPYFQYLNTIIPDAKWTVSYHCDSEPESMRSALSAAGVNGDIMFIKLGNLNEIKTD